MFDDYVSLDAPSSNSIALAQQIEYTPIASGRGRKRKSGLGHIVYVIRAHNFASNQGMFDFSLETKLRGKGHVHAYATATVTGSVINQPPSLWERVWALFVTVLLHTMEFQRYNQIDLF